jgi:hypothetical protein
MALARTNKYGAASGAIFVDTGWTTGAFTPADNSLLVCIVGCFPNDGSSSPEPVFTITDSQSLTWTKRTSSCGGITGTGYGLGMAIYTAPVTTGASMTITVDAGTRVVIEWAVHVLCYTGYDTGSPVGATAEDDTTKWTDGAAALTLSGSPASSSEVVASFLRAMNADSSVTPDGGWSEQYDVHVQFASGQQTQTRTGSTSTSVDWTDIAVTAAVAISIAAAIEIKEAGAGGGGGKPMYAYQQQ